MESLACVVNSVTMSNVRTTKNGLIYKTLVSVANSVALLNVRATKYGDAG